MSRVGFEPYEDEFGFWLWRLHGEYHTLSGDILPDLYSTDMATIPWYLRWMPFLNPYAPDTAVPCATHDLLLKLGVEQRVAAGWFYAEMTFWRVNKVKRIVYYLGVLAFSSDW